MMKVLIFGASGFVGPYLAKEFADHSYEVIGTDIKETSAMPFRCADILDADSVEQVVRETVPDMIVNLAAISSVGQSWKKPQMTMEVNVVGALNILEAARRQSPMPKVMFIGSSEEYAASDQPIRESSPLDANNPYGISKMAQERFAVMYRERYGMKVYCVRAFNHTGVGQADSFVMASFCRQVAEIEGRKEPGTIRVGNIGVKRDFSHVKDIVRAYRMVIESDDSSEIYNIGSGTAYGLDELLWYIISLSKQQIGVETDLSKLRPIDTQIVRCDHTLITSRLGWVPEHTVFDALKEMLEDYRSKIG